MIDYFSLQYQYNYSHNSTYKYLQLFSLIFIFVIQHSIKKDLDHIGIKLRFVFLLISLFAEGKTMNSES